MRWQAQEEVLLFAPEPPLTNFDQISGKPKEAGKEPCPKASSVFEYLQSPPTDQVRIPGFAAAAVLRCFQSAEISEETCSATHRT